jgi:hypothetical protein
MAATTCLKCGGHSFELVLFTPVGAQQKLNIAQCADCGTPVAVIDPGLHVSLSILQSQVSAIDRGLRRIAAALD